MVTVARQKNCDAPVAAATSRTRRVCLGLSLAAMLMGLGVMGLGLASSYGVIAAEPAATTKQAEIVPINLAGRWSGNHYANTMRAPIRIGEPSPAAVAPKLNTLTYDIVACGEEWCGIAVTDDKTCGAVALKMKRDTAKNRRNAFTGKLELAKGSAPYVVEAWYSAPDTKAGEGSEKAHLNFVGDTGGELLMMRRSFPFQAEMARVGEPTCTMEKATS
jgi:hypothetical protein